MFGGLESLGIHRYLGSMTWPGGITGIFLGSVVMNFGLHMDFSLGQCVIV